MKQNTLPRVVLALAVVLLSSGCFKKPPPLGPPVVQVTDVVQQDVPIYTEWVGTLDGSVNAEIRAMVTGYLLKQNYQDGTLVKKGDVLFEIDPRPFQAALDKAVAAEQKSSENVKRLTPLAAQNAVSQQELDNATQDNLADKAAVDAARINLDFTKVTSPIDGIAAIASAQLGDLVSQGSAVLTTVSQMDPIKAFFIVGEQDYLRYVRRTLESGASATNKVPSVELTLILADGAEYPLKGKTVAADRQLDPRTGSIRLAGEFPNPHNLLRPGQFARLRAVADLRKGALLVPQRAVTELQGTYQVAVVGPDSKVTIRAVQVGDRFDSMWVIEKGLNPGEKVVAEGVQKVKDGLEVTVQPFKTDLAPVPTEIAPEAE